MNSYRKHNERRNNNQRKFNGGTNKTCYIYNKTRHIAKNCWSKQVKINSAEVKQDENEQAFIIVAKESGGLLMKEA